MTNRLILWFCVKTNKVIYSKTFTFLLGIVIGTTFTYCWITGNSLYKEIFIGKIVVHNTSVAMASAGAVQERVNELGETGTASPSIETLIRKHFGDEADIAIAVAKAESGLNPETIGDRHLAKPSVGLFQINQIWHPYTTEQLQDPNFNCKIAKEIKEKGGWERWTTYRTGQYKKFL